MSKVERLRSSLRLIRILETGEAAQPGHVVIGLGRVINGFRPGVGHQELQPVGVPLLGHQLQPVINGIGNEKRFRGDPSELRMGNQQLRVVNLRAGERAVGVGDDSSEGIIYEGIETGDREGQAGLVSVVGTRDRQTLYPRPQVVELVVAAEGQMGSLLSDVFGVEHDVAGQLALEPEAPALLVGSPVACAGAQRSICIETHVVQQTERIPRGLYQSVGVGIVQVQVRSGAIVVKGSDHIGGLVETLGPVGHDASDARPRLSVVNSVPSSHHRFRKQIRRQSQCVAECCSSPSRSLCVAWSWQKLRRQSVEQLPADR